MGWWSTLWLFFSAVNYARFILVVHFTRSLFLARISYSFWLYGIGFPPRFSLVVFAVHLGCSFLPILFVLNHLFSSAVRVARALFVTPFSLLVLAFRVSRSLFSYPLSLFVLALFLFLLPDLLVSIRCSFWLFKLACLFCLPRLCCSCWLVILPSFG